MQFAEANGRAEKALELMDFSDQAALFAIRTRPYWQVFAHTLSATYMLNWLVRYCGIKLSIIASKTKGHWCNAPANTSLHSLSARSLAALRTLAELAAKTQIILFTHHAQVVEQAKQLRGRVQVQQL